MSTPLPRYNYIISKYVTLSDAPSFFSLALLEHPSEHNQRLDPFFALFIGISAATLRIRREEREKGESGDLSSIAEKLWMRGVKWGKGEYASASEQEKGLGS
ncbi:MAG: hypothetical protein Q9209_001401 [Squamulea sp. 1 TL-2023]